MNKSTTLDVQNFINEQPLSWYQWLIFILCFLIVAVDGFDTAAIGYIAPSLAQQWSIARTDLGPVLSAALFGLAAGAIFAGPLADRLGRKTILVLSVSFFGGWCLATAFAANLESMVILRFLTGLGLGAAMPNAITLMSEFAPQRRRALIVNTMFCGFPLGASLGGFASSWLIPHYGWQSVLLTGGVTPLLLSAVLLIALPESVRYLVAANKPAAKIRSILSRISRQSLEHITSFTMQEQVMSQAPSAIRVVLSKSYLWGSLMLWLTYFMGLLIFYFLVSWLPTLLKDINMPTQQAALLTALFPLGGGIGTILSGWLMDNFNPHKILAAGYALTAVLLFAVGQGTGNPLLFGVLVFMAGATMTGAQSSMASLAAGFYPTPARATGVAWMLGVGRFGGITGAFAGAFLASYALTLTQTFSLLTVPALIATAALLIKHCIAVNTDRA
ncbi:MAG: aromatic acid/H+ symport family MFS transporter [Methylococcaceae bacterium]